MLPLSFLAIGVLAYGVSAQTTAVFVNTTVGDLLAGQVLPIHWTLGDPDGPLSLFLANDTQQWTIFANQSASPGAYNWTVEAPVAGEYHLGLLQDGQLSVTLPFHISIILAPGDPSTTSTTTTTWTTSTSWPTLSPTANATLIYAPIDPTVTVTYWDHDCGCSKTSAVAYPTATATNPSGTQYSWWDETCGCTKSAVVPAPTVALGSNWTAPAPTTPGNNVPPPPPAATWAPTPAAPTPSGWTGDANKMMSSSFGVVALLAAVLLA